MKRILSFLLAAIAIGVPPLHADNRFRNGDIFEMRVSGPPDELTREFSVTLVVDEGSVNLPIIGRIPAANLTSNQLALMIEKRLKDEKIFTIANVNISLNTGGTQQRTIVIGGAVHSPGRQPWFDDLTLTAAISTAGGPSEWIKDKVKITRGGRVQTHSYKAIKKGTAPDPKILVGDVIDVEGDQ